MLTDARQLAGLARMDPQIAQIARIRTARPRHAERLDSLPAPANGWCYSAGEVAAMTGRKVKTIRDWIATGLMRGGRRVKLVSMRVPRGMIEPEALKRFMGMMNDE